MPANFLVGFDLNMTLLDDALVWYASVSKVCEVYGVKPFTFAEYFRELEENHGNFWPIYQRRGIPVEELGVKDRMNDIYQEEYRSRMNEIELSPGAPETLLTLKKMGGLLGIVTTQIPTLVEPLMERLSLHKLFDDCRIFTNVSEKAQKIIQLSEEAGVPLNRCFYLGDAPSDMHAAKRAGAKAVLYTPKHRPKNMHLPDNLIAAIAYDFSILHFSELPPLVEEILRENKP